MKSMKMETFKRSGKEKIRVDTRLRMDLTVLIDLRGRITLISLRDFKFNLWEEISSRPEQTMKKSTTFQPSLRYDFGWSKKPIARILHNASIKKIKVKIRPNKSIILFLSLFFSE